MKYTTASLGMLPNNLIVNAEQFISRFPLRTGESDYILEHLGAQYSSELIS